MIIARKGIGHWAYLSYDLFVNFFSCLSFTRGKPILILVGLDWFLTRGFLFQEMKRAYTDSLFHLIYSVLDDLYKFKRWGCQ